MTAQNKSMRARVYPRGLQTLARSWPRSLQRPHARSPFPAGPPLLVPKISACKETASRRSLNTSYPNSLLSRGQWFAIFIVTTSISILSPISCLRNCMKSVLCSHAYPAYCLVSHALHIVIASPTILTSFLSRVNENNHIHFDLCPMNFCGLPLLHNAIIS